MGLSRVLIGCCVLTSVLLWPSRAESDPILASVAITSGSVTVGEGQVGSAAFNLSGAGFVLKGSTVESLSLGPRVCFPCEEGAVIPTHATVTAPVTGTVTYLDQTWVLQTDVDSIFLPLVGPTLTAPAVSPIAGTILTLTAPFTLTNGNVMLLNDLGQIVFLASLSGQGIMELQLEAFNFPDSSFWQYKGVAYRFTDAAAPVPEPATLFMVAAGLAGILRRRMQRTVS